MKISSSKSVALIFILFLVNCGGISDYTKDLPGGYEFVSESNSQQLIHGNNILIPCTVKSYSTNKNFIIAAQSPAEECIQPNEIKVIAPLQFWIIVIQEKKLIGPLTLSDFIYQRKELAIPEDLKLQIEV